MWGTNILWVSSTYAEKGALQSKPAEIKAPEWDRSEIKMTLKRMLRQLWHLNGKIKRQVESVHGRNPVMLALQ